MNFPELKFSDDFVFPQHYEPSISDEYDNFDSEEEEFYGHMDGLEAELSDSLYPEVLT